MKKTTEHKEPATEYGRSIVNIFADHKEWAQDPTAYKAEIEATARKYVCAVMDCGQQAALLFQADMKEGRRYYQALKDFQNLGEDTQHDETRIQAFKIFFRQIRRTAEDLQTEKGNDQGAKKAVCDREGEDFKDFILAKDKERFAAIFSELLKGKKGKRVVAVMLAGIEAGIITRPPFKAVQTLAGEIGTKQGYNEYFRKGRQAYDADEIDTLAEYFRNL